MSGFAIRNPYLIVVACLVIAVVGVTCLVRMPVDLFPPINIPVVVVATFFNGMPPEQIETDITGRFERFFTLASGIEHMESRSLPGVSLIKVYFQPGTDADSAVTSISNLSMANLRRLPAGTLPPVVLKFDASSLPVCLITLKGQGLNETQLRDAGQYAVRNQVANVAGASVPQPFGGRYRQIMVYVDPLKLEAHQLSPMDVVRAVNDSNLIIPAGDVRIGPLDYSLYTNSQLDTVGEINRVPLKTVGVESVTVGDIGEARDAQQIQVNIVRVDSQPSVYLPVLKQGGDTNTIAVVDGVRDALQRLFDVPKEGTSSQSGVRSIDFRQAGHRDLAARGRDRLAADGPHGADVSRQPAGHAGGLPLDSALGARDLHPALHGWRHDQHHGPGRLGPGLLARNRQLGRSAREHLPSHGTGILPAGCRA
jgi:multidrug efflux pump subunit AcrB